ncbi:MAG: hypothetical protein EA397_14775 [Deltaproteobacteria bacterium]|nr:MAG: hypothetical protein EA397_14775 [Deltaproteobacteria bacterium]
MLLFLSVLFTSSAWAERPPGERIADALVIDVTEDGFEGLGAGLPGVVPTELDLPDVGRSGTVLFDWNLDVTGLFATLALDRLQMRPGDGELDIQADATLAVSNETSPARVTLVYHSWPWPVTLVDCNIYLRPVNLDAATSATIWAEDDGEGGRHFEASVAPMTWDWSLTGSDIRVENCLIGDINEVLELIDVSLFDLLIDPLEREIDREIQGLVDGLGDELATALNGFSLDETLDFNGAQLELLLEPEDVQITPDGMRLILAGRTYAEEHPCVREHGVTGSRRAGVAPPPIHHSSSAATRHHLGLLGHSDFFDQTLFAVYQSGAMCFDIEGNQGGVNLTTNVLGLLAPNAFDDFFPQAKPIKIELRPTRPPVLAPVGSHDITVDASDLKLDIYAELDGRQTALIGVDLDLEAGVDLVFSGDTGSLDIDLTLGGDSLRATSRPNELAPGTEQVIGERIGGLFDTLAAPMLGGALEGLSFQVPAFGGFGLANLEVEEAAQGGSWLGVYAHASAVPYGGGGGCDESGGCDSGAEGCAEGCSPLSGGGRGLTLLAIPLAVTLMRRRRSQTLQARQDA